MILYSQAVERLQEGGFALQSCNSNNANLQELMKGEGSVASHNCLWEKVLCYWYNPRTDTINITPYNCKPEAGTKRRTLSELSKIFEPLSLWLPITIQACTFINELWKLGLGWDEIVPNKLQSWWSTIAKELSEVSSISFQRQTINEGKEADVLVLWCL